MRKLVLKMSISVDGFVNGPGGEIDWIFRTMDTEAAQWTVDTLWQAGLHLMGSRTYHDMAAWWPTSTQVFAPPMNEIPKAVVTTRTAARFFAERATTRAAEDAVQARPVAGCLTPTPEAARSWSEPSILSNDLAAEIARLKQEPGKDILAHGGAGFAQSLVLLGLVDEFRLLTHPVALGCGRALFVGLSYPLNLQLISSSAFPGGCIAHIYRPSPAWTLSARRLSKEVSHV
ncbi:MAG: dihydrofolate reductase family protein [Terracidiphilus sp.]|jgi:dihydrofolate reductase